MTRFAPLVILPAWLLASTAAAQYFADDAISCRTCHESNQRKTDFCELFQAAVFEQDDKHGKAFFLLHETDPNDPQKGAAKRELIKRILGFELREAFADDRFTQLKSDTDDETRRRIATVKACLRCHATWPVETDAESPTLPPVNLELGVSCQACHGPGQKWNSPHYAVAWRVVTPEAKASLGFIDVRSAVTKARLCASCHIGNLAEQKFVKHEWYAGGHPPLPGFELAAFEAQMPRHWKSLAEKPQFALLVGALPREDAVVARDLRTLRSAGIPDDAIKSNYLEANFPQAIADGRDPAKDLSRVRDSIMGGAIIMESYVRLIAVYAAAVESKKAPWPELALYDCTACHHELRNTLASASRPHRNHPPGRPPLAGWTTSLAQFAAGSRWATIQQQWRQLDQATTARPFGNPSEMKSAADTLAASLDEVARGLSSGAFNQTVARQAIEVLADPARYETADFSTARQAAWALRELAIDLGDPGASHLFQSQSSDPLALRLPSGPRQSVMENLSRWLSAAARFDAGEFQKEIAAIRARAGGR